MTDHKRNFVIHDVRTIDDRAVSFNPGRFVGHFPNKVVSKMFTQVRGKAKSLKIAVRETTQGSAHKIYHYKVTKVHDPVTVERDGVEVTFKYSTKVKSVKS